MNCRRPLVIVGAVLLVADGVGICAPHKTPAHPPAKAPTTAKTPAKSVVPPPAVWRESGSPITGLGVTATRVMLTEGEDTMWLYGLDGKLQKTFVPHDADDFRVFTYDAALASDGKSALAASVDLGARLLDLDAGTVLGGLGGGMSRLNGVALSPDDKVAAIATSDEVKVFALPERRRLLGFAGMDAGAGSVAFSPDGTLLAVGGEDKSVHLFTIADGKEVVAWNGHEGAVRALAWSKDGKLLASGGRDGGVLVWDVAAQKQRAAIAPGEGAIESLSWSAGGTVLAVAVSPPGKESSVRPSEPERNPPSEADAPHPVVQLWALQGENATLKRAIAGAFGARRIAFLPDGKLLAGFADGKLAAYDLTQIPTVSPRLAGNPRPTTSPPPKEDAKGIRTLTGLAGGAQSVAFSPDGKLLAAGSEEAQVAIWEGKTGRFVRRVDGHTKGINSLAWSPDGTLLASGGEDRLQVARVADGKVLWSVAGRGVLAGFAPDNKTVFAFVGEVKPGSGDEQILRGWGALDGKPGPLLGQLPYPMRAALSPDGTTIAADQGTSDTYWDTTVLSLFQVVSGQEPDHRVAQALSPLGGLHGRVNALRWMSRTRILVDEGDYWDGHNDYQKPVPNKLGVLTFNPTGAATDKPLLGFEMPIVALDENSRGELAVAEDWRGVYVYDVKRNRVAQWEVPSHNLRVKSLAWSPDGSLLAIGIEGETLRLWRVLRMK